MSVRILTVSPRQWSSLHVYERRLSVGHWRWTCRVVTTPRSRRVAGRRREWAS